MVYGDHESERRQLASFESSPVKQEVIAMSKLAERSKTVTYYVNGEALTTTEHKLTVREILLAAGFEGSSELSMVRSRSVGSSPVGGEHDPQSIVIKVFEAVG
jgi:hypothetical protein